MQIKNMYVSVGVKHFTKAYEKMYNLKAVDAIDKDEPTVFIGCYTLEEAINIKEHYAPVVLVWMGIDATRDKIVEFLGCDENIRHISISSYIFDSLRLHNIDSHLLMLPNTDIDYWKPCKLGNKIYSYAPNEIYGRSLVEKISKLVKYDVVLIDSCKDYTRSQLKELYKDSFVGLRLRQFDGSPASIHEMGLMGRKTISNARTPTSISWENEKDIIRHIEKEAKNIGKEPYDNDAKLLYNFLDVGKNWLIV
jgi:hypothetical protein